RRNRSKRSETARVRFSAPWFSLDFSGRDAGIRTRRSPLDLRHRPASPQTTTTSVSIGRCVPLRVPVGGVKNCRKRESTTCAKSQKSFVALGVIVRTRFLGPGSNPTRPINFLPVVTGSAADNPLRSSHFPNESSVREAMHFSGHATESMFDRYIVKSSARHRENVRKRDKYLARRLAE